MRADPSTVRRAAIAFMAAAGLVTTLASAEPAPKTKRPAAVRLAEVASRVDPAKIRLANVTELLRLDAEAELAAIDWGKLPRRYAVSAAVVRLESARTGERSLEAACTVSAAVREADTGTLLFIVEGKASAEDAATAAERAERDALSAAVRGAIAAVPEGLRRAR